MRRVMTSLAMVLWAGLAGAQEASPKVVVELFTSQGCVSCPPADRILMELREVEGVLPLAFHVDYWDYIGWKDVFARPEFSARQMAYARGAQSDMVYTPQMVVQGQKAVLGGDGVAIGAAIRASQERWQPFAFEARRLGDRLEVRAPSALTTPVLVQLVQYQPQAQVEILAGENAGLEMVYGNIVTRLEVLGEWQAAEPATFSAPPKDAEKEVVLLQEAGLGRIVALFELD